MRAMSLKSCVALGVWLCANFCLAQKALPVIDLGYQRHQAIHFNDSAKTYNFSNIRFAQPPVGDLRFRAPVPAWIGSNSSTINNGSIGTVCPQASAAWELVAEAFVPKYLTGQSFNETEFLDHLAANGSSVSSQPVDPRTSEDCLFLDVVVPEVIFSNSSRDGAPVLVWIYGGGYTSGEKTGSGRFSPYGLFQKAHAVTGEQFVYIALNYRLGVFGWLPGATLQADGTANAGLYDQRTALEWIQKYIHLFGGDPARVTVMGESAGGGSIVHQITAFNGKKPTPFAQAIPQSPAWLPITSSDEQEAIFNDFLEFANVTSLSEARALSTEQLQLANTLHVGVASYGSFIYGPVVDGIFAPQLPGRALLSGQDFDNNVRLLVGHNGDEALFFTEPNTTTDAAFNDLISTNFPSISQEIRTEITDELYPAMYDGSYGYTTPYQRALRLISDGVFTCNTYYLANTLPNQTHSYQFNVPPALHGNDIDYTFAWNETGFQAPNVVTALQEYIVSFVITGDPNSKTPLPSVPPIPVYGSNYSVTVLDLSITYARDFLAGSRCDFWQEALYA